MNIQYRIYCVVITLLLLNSATAYSNVEMEARFDKEAYIVGDPIIARIQIKNAGSTPVTITPPSYANIAVTVRGYWKNQSMAIGGRPITLGPGEKTEEFAFSVIRMSPHGLLIPAGNHEIVIAYRNIDSVILEAHIRNVSARGEDKYEAWKKWEQSSPDEQIRLGRDYIGDFGKDNDPISYHMRIGYLYRAVIQGLDNDHEYIEKALKDGFSNYGERPELFEMKAYWEKLKGADLESIRLMGQAHLDVAVNWMANYISDKRSKTAIEKIETINVVKELSRRTTDSSFALRLKVLLARAHYKNGDIPTAIELIRPIYLDEAEKWQRELLNGEKGNGSRTLIWWNSAEWNNAYAHKRASTEAELSRFITYDTASTMVQADAMIRSGRYDTVVIMGYDESLSEQCRSIFTGRRGRLIGDFYTNAASCQPYGFAHSILKMLR